MRDTRSSGVPVGISYRVDSVDLVTFGPPREGDVLKTLAGRVYVIDTIRKVKHRNATRDDQTFAIAARRYVPPVPTEVTANRRVWPLVWDPRHRGRGSVRKGS